MLEFLTHFLLTLSINTLRDFEIAALYCGNCFERRLLVDAIVPRSDSGCLLKVHVSIPREYNAAGVFARIAPDGSLTFRRFWARLVRWGGRTSR